MNKLWIFKVLKNMRIQNWPIDSHEQNLYILGENLTKATHSRQESIAVGFANKSQLGVVTIAFNNPKSPLQFGSNKIQENDRTVKNYEKFLWKITILTVHFTCANS